jgi:hypothetical protein
LKSIQQRETTSTCLRQKQITQSLEIYVSISTLLAIERHGFEIILMGSLFEEKDMEEELLLDNLGSEASV